MTSKLKTHFPLIREHEEILTVIRSNPNLANIYNSWTAARQKEELAEKDHKIHNLLETQKHAIKNMLQDNMSIEKIATLLGCAISDVEDVKKSMDL